MWPGRRSAGFPLESTNRTSTSDGGHLAEHERLGGFALLQIDPDRADDADRPANGRGIGIDAVAGVCPSPWIT